MYKLYVKSAFPASTLIRQRHTGPPEADRVFTDRIDAWMSTKLRLEEWPNLVKKK